MRGYSRKGKGNGVKFGIGKQDVMKLKMEYY